MSNLNVRGQCRCRFIMRDHLGNYVNTLYCILPTGHEGVHRDANWNPWMNRNEIMENVHKGFDNPFAKSTTGRRIIFLPKIGVPDE